MRLGVDSPFNISLSTPIVTLYWGVVLEKNDILITQNSTLEFNRLETSYIDPESAKLTRKFYVLGNIFPF